MVRQESANKATRDASAIGLSGSTGVVGVAATEGVAGKRSGERLGVAGAAGKSGRFGTGASATWGVVAGDGAGEDCGEFTRGRLDAGTAAEGAITGLAATGAAVAGI